MTQLEYAKNKKITPEMKKVASCEGVSAEYIRAGIEKGAVVILKNSGRKMPRGWRISGIGKGLRTKVNANMGSSPDSMDIARERKKLESALAAGADTVMDLSTGGNLARIRKMVLADSSVPVGTVPIYQAACETFHAGRDIARMKSGDMFRVIEQQARDGVDFMTVHCGVTRENLRILRRTKRLTGIVSRGGAFLARWITENRKENPLFENFSYLLDIAYKYDVTLSLGDGLRPGCLADANDAPQIAELRVLGRLAGLAYRRNVQVIIEGPGHVPLNKIEKSVLLEKKVCRNAPFYVLGPLVTDIAAGYDHITCAIGGAIAGSAGADFLCYVTPAEHLRLPDEKDVFEGVIASRIAAHAADIAKGVKGAMGRDIALSRERRKFNWKKQELLSIDPSRFRNRRRKSRSGDAQACTMCGRFCAMKQFNL